jgi:membrane protein implicated in regulation of membrane protease activity
MHWFGDNMWASWMVIAAALALLEVASTDLIFIMLAVGAVGGVVVALLGGPVVLQIIVALIVALALLALIRPGLVHRLHAGPTLAIGAEALIGKRAFVLEPLTHVVPGRVKIGGDVWTAQPFDEDDVIEAGTTVDVVSIKGATAYVVRKEEAI